MNAKTAADFKRQSVIENVSKWENFEIQEGKVFQVKGKNRTFSSFRDIANTYNRLQDTTEADKVWGFSKKAKVTSMDEVKEKNKEEEPKES